ncbi:MAG: antitoxin VbhA family protein [Bacteroidales bacterium]|nr:antitoxin VbhA family protein [Candidatus Liminaster caballi]
MFLPLSQSHLLSSRRGLTTSEYLQETARRNIEGEITIEEAQPLIHNYYVTKTVHDENDADLAAALEYDLEQERQFSYSLLSSDEIIRHK